jgi:uncharacterized membrane protein YkoI
MKRWRAIAALLILTVSLGSASAQPWRHRGRSPRFISPSQAVEIARRQNDGRVLSVDLVQGGGGRSFYKIKMISGGRIRTVTVDAYARD